MIVERVVDSMDGLARELNVLPNHFAFRGQANADWGLKQGRRTRMTCIS